ncbi:MAG: cation transporter [Propionibacteriaceae bacterium]|jgi:copper chaperone CopZ|nr:cation transporter [Propionibacteriaceae bacterium]
MITEYAITGMTCEHCVAHVKEEVLAIPEVTAVALTLADARLSVTSTAPIALQTIVDAVAEAGDYQVSLL